MNKKIKEDWVKALRSGKYKQGKGELHNKEDNTFCCLGVLCDLYIKEKEIEWQKKGANVGKFYPSGVITNWAGAKPINTWGITHNEGATSIDCLNDRGFSFETLAKLIEEQL